MASIVASQVQQVRPFTSSASTRQSRPRAVRVVAAAPHQGPAGAIRKVAGAAAAAAILFGAPAVIAAPEGQGAEQVRKRITEPDSMRGSGAPDQSDTAYPETSGGSGAGGVPPQPGRSNLTSTSAAPEAAKEGGGVVDKVKDALKLGQ